MSDKPKKPEAISKIVQEVANLPINTEQLPDTIEGVQEMLKGLILDGHRVMLLHVWHIGRIIKKIQEDEGRYGAHAVEKVAEALNKQPRLFYEMLRFHNAYPDVQRVAQMKLEWSAAREILRIEDKKVREQVVKQAEANDSPVREVREMVNKVKGDGAPPPPRQPGKQIKALPWFKKLETELENDMKSLEELLESKADMMHIVSDEKRTPAEDYEAIVEGKEDQPALADAVAKLGERLISLIKREVVSMQGAFKHAPSEPSSSGEEED